MSAADAILYAEEKLREAGLPPMPAEKRDLLRAQLETNPATIPFFIEGVDRQVREHRGESA